MGFLCVCLRVQGCFMAHATTLVKCHNVASVAQFPESIHKMAWSGEKLYKAIHSWLFSINLLVLKEWGDLKSSLQCCFSQPFSWLWKTSSELDCVVSRLALVWKRIRNRNVQHIIKRKGNSTSVGYTHLWECLDFGQDPLWGTPGACAVHSHCKHLTHQGEPISELFLALLIHWIWGWLRYLLLVKDEHSEQ